jgi:DNA-binding PadR family transcriptional regulator
MPQQNTTAYIILGLLSHEKASGYELKKKIDMSISHFWQVSYGQLYPTLKKLEEEGAVKSQLTPSHFGPDRIVYGITEKGKEKLAAWLILPHDNEHVRYEILLKLFFGNLSSPEQNIAKIKDFGGRHKKDLEMMTLFKENLAKVLEESPDHLYYYLTVLFGERIYEAYLSWAKEAVLLLEDHMAEKERKKDLRKEDDIVDTSKNS